jgi:hypothetical protein
MAQVDLGLTGLTRLIRSLALMKIIKNLGRHIRPLNMCILILNIKGSFRAKICTKRKA